MTLPVLTQETDAELHKKIKSLKDTEARTTAEIILHLYEIDTRGIYRDLGYSSLFSYCTEYLGYSESGAYRRITAARALKDNPELYELIGQGKISLSALGAVAKVLKPENKEEVLGLSLGKSSREAERVAAQFLPAESRGQKKETLRVLRREISIPETPLFQQKEDVRTEERYSLSFELSKEEMELLEKARTHVGHCELKKVLLKAAAEFVSRREKKSLPAPEVKSPKLLKRVERYIPVPVRQLVKERDGHQCSYVSPEGKRCSEKCRLEFDHVVPVAVGGVSSVGNLRLLCRAHNQLEAERAFGREFVAAKRI